jgi:hypothetical protein
MSYSKSKPTMRTLAAVALSISLIGVLGGCSKTGMNQRMGQSEVRQEPKYEQKTPTNVEAEQSIQTIEATSQNVYENVKASQWEQASDELSKLKQARNDLKSSGLGKGSDQYVDRISMDLQKQIGQKDRLPAMESANQLTRAAMDLGEPVPSTTPKELSLLDYYGRELEIGVISNDKNKLSAASRDIKHTWNAIKPKVEAQEGGKGGHVAQFDQLVKQLDKAKSTQDYQKVSGKFTDHVDAMQGLYGKNG